MRIALVTPASKKARSGNRHTAVRWAAFLRSAGHRVELMNEWAGQATDLMLALHALRSYVSVASFRAAHPTRPLLLALTGTDVYRDIHVDDKAKKSLLLSDRFIVLQSKAIEELPPPLRDLASVVYQSCASTRTWNPVKRGFRVAVIGHLRDEKDPLRTAIALARVPDNAGISVVQIGGALDTQLGSEARELEKMDPRYRWMESVTHARALAWLASSHVLVISSKMEGGANVVSEAIKIGVPILASAISGNIGLLGDGYPGYFPTGNDRALAELMMRTATDRRLLNSLRQHVLALQPRFTPVCEAAMLNAAVRATAPLIAR